MAAKKKAARKQRPVLMSFHDVSSVLEELRKFKRDCSNPASIFYDTDVKEKVTYDVDNIISYLEVALDIAGEKIEEAIENRPTTCGFCTYEEADGELIEQCKECKEKDQSRRQRAALGKVTL